jgi:hypothetical protein
VGDTPHSPLELVLWRLEQLEDLAERRRKDDLAVERAMQHELAELRQKIPDLLMRDVRENYHTRAEARNVFVTREEVQRATSERRQWPLIVSAIVVSAVAIVNLIIALRGGR